MPLRTFGEDSLFGELALIDAAPRSATAITKSPVTLPSAAKPSTSSLRR